MKEFNEKLGNRKSSHLKYLRKKQILSTIKQDTQRNESQALAQGARDDSTYT